MPQAHKKCTKEKPGLKQSSKCAIGGIVAAVSLVLMISVAIIPFLTYALPAVAGLFIVFIVIEIDKKWAFGVYCTVAILGMLLVPDKEVAVMYLAFFANLSRRARASSLTAYGLIFLLRGLLSAF